MSEKSGQDPFKLNVVSRTVALYNCLRDLGDLKPSDVPPSFIEKFVETSEGRISPEEASQAPAVLTEAASAVPYETFHTILAEGKWPGVLKRLEDSIDTERFREYANVMIGVIQASELQSFDRDGLAKLQYNWG